MSEEQAEVVQGNEEITTPHEEVVVNEEEITAEAEAKEEAPEEEKVEYKRFKEVYGALKRTERELEKVKSSKETPQTQQSTTEKPTEKPTEDGFETFDEYNEALLDWKIDQRETKKGVELKEQDVATQKEELFKKIDGKVSDATAKDPKFFENAYIPEAFASLLADSDHFTEFGYYFAGNMGEVQRLLAMPSDRAAMEIGKLEATFKLPKPKTTTRAPEPTKPLGGSTTVSKNPDDMTQAEFETWRDDGGGGG